MNTITRIFAEYLYCNVSNGKETKQLTPENLENCVRERWKLQLKSIYDIEANIAIEVANKMRYNRGLMCYDWIKDTFEFTSITSNNAHTRNSDTAIINITGVVI